MWAASMVSCPLPTMHCLPSSLSASQKGTGMGQEWGSLRACAGGGVAGLSPAPAAVPGDQFSCPVHSWSTGEEVAGDILRHRLAPGIIPVPACPRVPGKEGGGGEGETWETRPPNTYIHRVHSGHAWGLAHIPGFLQAIPVGSIPHFCPSMCCHQGAGRWLAGLDSGHEEWGPVGRAGRPRLRAGPGVRPRAAQELPETEVLLHRGCRRAHGRQGKPKSVVWEQLGLR
uniref:Uncharacterized protein n=1 Tax=Canis lupus familiaris TaxID=9615 RepID=A0A8C0Q146_CANLF